ncbi:MAG: type I-D CRISPR-associated protein Cas5/Csc1 [Tolypothrix sp. Co-bin9]|nr:type I-D CRISPR-associated protein Cas5/Csc1 [Tolypothrix sp. Co-bin9]
MNIFRLDLTLHDYLFFASREIGYLWETVPLIHNYALTYALGFCHSTYHFSNPQIPKYSEHLEQVNIQGLYLTPARVNFALSGSQLSDIQTWSFAFNGESNHLQMASREYTKYNNPLIGRNKSIHPEVVFTAYLIAQNCLPAINRWIRLGKWDSKAEVKLTKLSYCLLEGEFISRIYLNPLDVHPKVQMRAFDIFNMPPSSLINNLSALGKFIKLDDGEVLPWGLSYRIVEN